MSSIAAEESGLYSKKRLGRSAAFTLEADFWNNGGAARNSLSQRTIAGRLHPGL